MERAVANGTFDQVPFKDMRSNLLEVLQIVDLMKGETSVDRRIAANEQFYGWGSLLRCSLTGWRKKNDIWGYGCESRVVIDAMKDPGGKPFFKNCVRRFLIGLSERTRAVILLGNDNNYMKEVRKVAAQVFADYRPGPGPSSFTADGRTFVHVAHPSGTNGYRGEFLTGSIEKGQGAKREEARDAIRAALAGCPEWNLL